MLSRVKNLPLRAKTRPHGGRASLRSSPGYPASSEEFYPRQEAHEYGTSQDYALDSDCSGG